MPSTRRFERIARDLEKLPCELHEPILVDLEFQQLIRLSPFAGPRLISSLQNSLSPWAKFFRNKAGIEYGKFLAVTDLVKKLCFRPPKTKEDRPNIFERGSLSFLHHRSADWTSQVSCARQNGLHDVVSLSRHWLRELNEQIIDNHWIMFHQDYSTHIKPWVPYLDSPADVLEKVLALSTYTTISRSRLSIDHLATFIDRYQELRLKRAEALAGELYRLADLYDANPMRLKMPLAPETRRRNEKHVPQQMRYEAIKLVNRARMTHWRAKTERYQFRLAGPFPALVPYDWCIQLFVRVLSKNSLSGTRFRNENVEDCRIVLERPPQWVVGVPKAAAGQANVDSVAEMSKSFELLGVGDLTQMRIVTERAGGACHSNDLADLEWLERFLVIIAWMEDEFPDVVREVRGDSWEGN